MVQFASATFTAADGTELSAADASWSKVNSVATVSRIKDGRVYSTSGIPPKYVHSAVPPSADYEVSADLYILTLSTDYSAGPIARAVSGGSCYWARYRRGTGWQLFRYNGDTATQLGNTVTDSISLYSTVKVRLRVAGDVISVYRGDETDPIISVTDVAPLTDAGRAGIQVTSQVTDGVHLDNFSADTLGSAYPSVTLTGVESTEAFGSLSISADVSPSISLAGIPSGEAFGSLSVSAVTPQEWFDIVPDGVWTWFTDPRAVFRNGATYIGWVNSAGTCGISKLVHSTGVVTSFALSATGLEIDDHNNTAVHFLPDGRIMALYCKHNDTSGMRYRISTYPEDISAWSAEVLLGALTKPVSYSNPHYLSATEKTYLHYRSGLGGSSTNPMNVRAFDGASWDAERTWITQNDERPYIKSVSNGVDRIDFLLTNCHPNEGQAKVYHCYMQLDGSVEKLYKSDGTLIGTGPVTPADCTLIYDGSTVDAWIWDIAYGHDGHPRVLFSRFPSTTDHRYMFTRWTGATWTAPVEIAAGGTYLYAAEPYYSGGLCFDAQNADVVYLSMQVGSYWEVQEWRTPDSGLTWAKARDITTASTVRNCRPYSPRNHDGRCAVLFWRGTYTNYTTYSTAIKGAASDRVEVPLTNRSGTPTANLSGLDYAVLDAARPGDAGKLLARGKDGRTDASGVFRAAAPGAGGAAFVVVSDTDGSTSADSSAFAAPVAVI